MPTRRTVLTAAVLAGALAACTPEDDGPGTSPRIEPDELLTAEARGSEQALVDLIDRLTSGHQVRKRVLAPTRRIHIAHVELLTPPVPEGTLTTELHVSPGPPFTGDDRAAYLMLAKAEDRLGQTLRRAAFQAESGPLARVLAGMAAAAAQQSVVLRGRL